MRLLSGLMPLVFLVSAVSAFAETVSVTCSAPKNFSRPESIAAIKYVLDTDSGKGQIACATRLNNDVFCRSMRTDLSAFLNSVELEKCGQYVDQPRQVFTFLLQQEDEFNNVVSIYLSKDCKGKVIPTEIKAVISDNPTGEIPVAVELVKCRIAR